MTDEKFKSWHICTMTHTWFHRYHLKYRLSLVLGLTYTIQQYKSGGKTGSQSWFSNPAFSEQGSITDRAALEDLNFASLQLCGALP